MGRLEVTEPQRLHSPFGGTAARLRLRATALSANQRGGPVSPPPLTAFKSSGGVSNCVHVTCSKMRVGKARARAAVDVIPRKHPRWDLPSELRARTAQAQSAARRCRSWRALGQPNRPPDPPPEANLQPAFRRRTGGFLYQTTCSRRGTGRHPAVQAEDSRGAKGWI